MNYLIGCVVYGLEMTNYEYCFDIINPRVYSYPDSTQIIESDISKSIEKYIRDEKKIQHFLQPVIISCKCDTMVWINKIALGCMLQNTAKDNGIPYFYTRVSVSQSRNQYLNITIDNTKFYTILSNKKFLRDMVMIHEKDFIALLNKYQIFRECVPECFMNFLNEKPVS